MHKEEDSDMGLLCSFVIVILAIVALPLLPLWYDVDEITSTVQSAFITVMIYFLLPSAAAGIVSFVILAILA